MTYTYLCKHMYVFRLLQIRLVLVNRQKQVTSDIPVKVIPSSLLFLHWFFFFKLPCFSLSKGPKWRNLFARLQIKSKLPPQHTSLKELLALTGPLTSIRVKCICPRCVYKCIMHTIFLHRQLKVLRTLFLKCL